MKRILIAVCLCSNFLFAEDEKPPVLDLAKEETIETRHKVKVGGEEISFTALAGTIPIKTKEEKAKAAMFFVSYTKDGVENQGDRPITFCFNGGPGSASIWLHMGVFGPKRVVLAPDNRVAPPYDMIDNNYSILDLTDLVFIDPISTGFSKTVTGEDPKQFHGAEEDIDSVAEFILHYTSKYKRWDSPKYLAGESYGTLRAAGLALKLHEDDFYFLNGVILVSSILNYQTISDAGGNDLCFVLSLPTFTATALYHKKLAPELQQNLAGTLRESELFAMNVYGPALLKGDLLNAEERDNLAKELSRLTGLSEPYLVQSNFRVPVSRFAKELLRSDASTVGRFDSRFKGIDGDLLGCNFENDPSLDVVAGAYTAMFNQYVRADLNYTKTDNYKILANVWPWNWGKSHNSFFATQDSLREVMSRNPNLKIFVASGTYDLATPYFATEYTFNHMNLSPRVKPNVRFHYYDAGHMMYIHEPSLIKMKDDLKAFYKAK